MSQDVYVFLSHSTLPSLDVWQSALHDLGGVVVLDAAFKPHQDRGFVPCKVGSATGGFEFFLPSSDTVEDDPQLRDHIRRYDSCAVFTWGGELVECVAATSAAAALAAAVQGIMYDPQENACFSVPEAQAYARGVVAEFGAPS